MSLITNLVSYYPLTANANDVVGTTNGTATNVTFATSGGKTYSVFNGSTSKIDLGSGAFNFGTGALTVSGWIYFVSIPSGAASAILLGRGVTGATTPQYSGFALAGYSNTAYWYTGGGGSYSNATQAITTGQWYHMVGTRSGTTTKFYIDGTLVSTVTTPFVYDVDNSLNASIGAIYTTGWFTVMDGYIWDTAVWNRELSASEVTQIYNAGNANNPLSTLLPGPATLRGMFASAVHDAPPAYLKLEGMFSSVVHTAPPAFLKLEGMFSSVVHSVPTPAAIVPNITGSPGVPATFDGSASTMVTYYHWKWVSVPGGSPLRAPFDNAPIPFPDNGVATPINMTDNEGLWHFDNNANDTSGTGNNATVSGTSYVTGKVGTHAIDFSSGDYVEVPNDASLNSSTGTVSFWLKTSTSTAGSNASVMGKNDSSSSINGWHIFLDNNQINAQLKGPIAFISTTMGPAGPALNDGAWHHIVLVFVSGGTSKMFVDGALVATQGSTVSFSVTAAEPMRMAVNVDTWWNDYVGAIDEVALWSRALSDSEVADIYLAQGGTIAGFGSPTFTFTPDIVGTYRINLAIDGSNNTNADCVVTLPSGGAGAQGEATQGAQLQGHNTQGLV